MNEPTAQAGPNRSRSTEDLLHVALGSARRPDLSSDFLPRLRQRLAAQESELAAAAARRRAMRGILLGYGLVAVAAMAWILLALPSPEEPARLNLFVLATGLCLALATGLALLAFWPRSRRAPALDGSISWWV